MTCYINIRYPNREIETVSECSTWEKARKELLEYRFAYRDVGYVYISQRPTNLWREKDKPND